MQCKGEIDSLASAVAILGRIDYLRIRSEAWALIDRQYSSQWLKAYRLSLTYVVSHFGISSIPNENHPDGQQKHMSVVTRLRLD